MTGRPANPIRAKALASGAATFEGRPCPSGHTTRHTRSRACVTCQADAQRRRRASVQSADDILG
jgi:hypothetical protein